ncbi:unnamed protein product [Schistosoma rodhaini]|uniref:RING-type E3 ubiquitin transferase n=1 Tax=Schistosoma rodhaini TaxID=6188 RepID=A0AA85F836_9TREM|nr:unnamed protein product [Schistosoma rodhaini]
MAIRRRADVLDPDFTVIRQQITKLMQHNIHDCKSFLLMLKSLFPSSIKLEIIEYELMQEYGDATLAAEILCRLYETQRHLDMTQIELLSKIVKDPTDKVCCDIFSHINPSLQKDLTLSYFNQMSDMLRRAEIFYPQVLPILLALAYQSLIDGELTMHKSNRISATSGIMCHSSSVDKYGTLIKNENVDEGEEGEVMGCDDEDEFADDLDNPTPEIGDSPWTDIYGSVLNVYRFKIAYELLPLAYKASNSTKMDKNVIYKISVTAINFLVTYITHVPANPSIEGLEKNELSAKKDPKTYITDCLKMVGHLLQWPIATFDFTSSKTVSYLVQQTRNLFREAKSSCDSVSTKRDSRSGRKLSSFSLSHKSHAIVFQALCMFWYTLVDLGTAYLHKVHNGIFDGSVGESTLPRVLYLPINLDILFNSTSHKNLSFENEAMILLKHIHEVWGLREYTSASYSFGSKEIDSLDNIHPHANNLSEFNQETLFEQIIRFHLALSGLNNNSQEIIWAYNFINKLSDQLEPFSLTSSKCNLYNRAELRLISWILQMILLSHDHDKSKVLIKSEARNGLWDQFLQDFKSLLLLINQSKDEKICIQDICPLVPFTRQCVVFVVSKTIASYLCTISRQTTNPTLAVDSACLACILCQVDGKFGDISHPAVHWPSLSPYFSEVIHTHWVDVRDRFLKWIISPHTFIFDVDLLNTIFRLESNVEAGTDWSDRDTFLSRCTNLVQSKPPDAVDSVLEEFIHLESSNISICLASLQS